ncbi:MAG: hypothetical protein GXO66_08095 [Euryarchaeota archaeon]|nr:hypothetical protein [Euryarchaeota archaeon]
MSGDLLLPLLALAVGIKHGVDWDHIAAIMDITATQHSRRRGVLLSFLYAVGHASVVATLALLGLLLGVSLPEGVDELMEKLVGTTLVVLGAYVLYSLGRHGDEFRLVPRWVLAANVLLGIIERGRSAITGMPVRERRVRRRSYGGASACVVGMIHGIGAETPTQVVLFALTLGAGAAAGRDTAVLLILSFVAGLIVTNTAMGVLGAYGIATAADRRRVYRVLGFAVGLFSLVLGALFLLGGAGFLPDLQAML